jgi:hypothetical protein
MTSQELTPTNLTFYSFRHSQGDPSLQASILRFIENRTGITSSFETDGPTLESYYRFLGGHATRRGLSDDVIARRHARVFTPNQLEKKVKLALEGVAIQYADTPIPSLGDLTSALNLVEHNRFREITDSIAGPALTRAVQRLEAGQHSFIDYYGRQHRSTGFDALDTMYADVWKHFSGPDFTDYADMHKQSALNAACAINEAIAV